jgi:hypothetical protein
MNTVKPVGMTLDRYLESNDPTLSWIARKLLRRKFERANYKYFSGHRTGQTFERYKNYRMMVFAKPPASR